MTNARRDERTARVRLTRLLLHAALAGPVSVFACAGSGAADPHAARGHALLFVGNSLTYVNDLPRTLVDVAASGGERVTATMVAFPNYAVIDHATENGRALDAIRRGGWELVVLQQGPTSRAIDRDTLVLGTRLLDAPIRAAGARTALYMVWPARADSANFDAIRDAYRRAACSVDGLFLPAGEAWRAAWRAEPSVPLYGPDDFHPGPLGTYLAALVMYERVTGRDARSLPTRVVVGGVHVDVDVSTVRLLQAAAHEANTTYATACASRKPAGGVPSGSSAPFEHPSTAVPDPARITP